MKFSKLMSAALIASSVLASISVADAASFGRSSSSSSSSRSSSSSFTSRPSTTYSQPAAAPKSSGFGGTSGSMGVRKSEVTAPVAAKVQQSRAVNAPIASSTGSSSGYNSAPHTPAYNSPPVPQYTSPQTPSLGAGGVFASSLGGSLVGSALGNMMFGSHGSSGSTNIVNNSGSAGTSGGAVTPSSSSNIASNSPGDFGPSGFTQTVPPFKKAYSMGDFIVDLLLFACLIAVVVGIAFLFYKGYKVVKSYIQRERGVSPTTPFSPTAQFWLIQRAFASGDANALKPLLGPDLVDEATSNLEASEISLSNVSHEVVLSNPREFSVHYTFLDDNMEVNQVWHYELHNSAWKLNGIETV